MATAASVWSRPGAWALEAEENDAELHKQQTPSSDFPSLAAASTTKTKKKKNKPQTISLAEFTHVEIASLPTGPRQRSAEELDKSKLGNGFRSYGSESSNSRWGEERKGNRESVRDLGPSRADETDNWAAGKKQPIVGGNGYERRERGSGGGFFESQSKADEVDSWVSSKPPTESRRFDKKGGSFESLSRNRDSSGGVDSESWGRRREEITPAPAPAPSSVGGSRQKLMLQPRTLPVTVVEVKPESPEKLVIVDRPKGANPFGNARPREEVLAEKGQDWKEIEEKLEADKLKEVAVAIEKPVEKSPGKMGFGGRKDDDRTERSWRKSTEQFEERAHEEEVAVEEADKKEEVVLVHEDKEQVANNKDETLDKN